MKKLNFPFVLQFLCSIAVKYWPSDCVVFNTFFNSINFQVHHGGQCTYTYFPGNLLTSTQHIFSKPFAAFPHNDCWNSWLNWERNESSFDSYHQSLVRILVEQVIKQDTSHWLWSRRLKELWETEKVLGTSIFSSPPPPCFSSQCEKKSLPRTRDTF